MNFISYAQLYDDIIEFSHKLPHDLDAVVGIPRSGLVPASILATHMNLKLGVLCDGSILILDGGVRDTNHAYNKILVLDDSIDSGHTIEKAMADLSRSGLTIHYGCIYSNPECSLQVEFIARKLKQPRLFAWNFMNSGMLAEACVDIDGVLCVDPDPDGDYMAFLRGATPLYRPRHKIHSLVTGRLEKHRLLTEDWLIRHHVEYDNLIMRQTSEDNIEEMKRDYYKTSGCKLFIESSTFQSPVIAKSGPVICVEDMQLYDSSST